MKKQILLLLFLLTACQPVAAITSVKSVTPIKPTTTLIKPTSTATMRPVETNTATVTPQPTIPERPLSPSGPWVFVPLNKTFFIINPDGTGYTVLKHDLPSNSNSQILKVAAQGNMVAYVEGTRGLYDENPEYIMLNIRTFPSNDEVKIPLTKSLKLSAFTTFFNEGMSAPKTDYDQYMDTTYAIGDLAWSPDGKYLAFTGAVDGPTSDVYVYSKANGSIKRLSDATTQAIYLHWSPDSRSIVYAAATSLNIGRSGGGYDVSALWAVNPDNAETKKLLDLSDDVDILGWMSTSKLAIAHFGTSMDPYDSDLQVVDINTREIKRWFDGKFQMNGYDPQDKVFLFSLVNEWWIGHSDPKQPDGTYLLTQAGQQKKISDMKLNRFFSGWHPEIKRFLVQDTDGNGYSISIDGKIEKMPFLDGIETYVSPNGKYWSGLDDKDHLAFKVGAWNGQNTVAPGSETPIWSPDSQYYYALTSGDFSVVAAPDFKTLKTIPIAPGEFTWQSPVWVTP